MTNAGSGENFSKANQIAQARKTSAICGIEKSTSVDFSQIALKKSCDYLFKIDSVFLLSRFFRVMAH